MNNTLNQRQQTFVEGILRGMSQRDAYVAAGYKSSNPDREASDLLKLPKVSEVLESRRMESRSETTLNRAEAMSVLAQVARTGDSSSARVRAVEAACKLEGWNAPEKVDTKLEIIITKL
jgi:phage terminase small subunit